MGDAGEFNSRNGVGQPAVCRVLGICGSLRAGSHNRALLNAAMTLAPAGMEISVYSGLRELPPYDGSLDTPANRPAEAEELRRLIEEADGLLIVTPEYNCSVPGVLKNALDWVGAVLPGEAIPLEGKPIAITGASPSAFGSVRAQHALRLMLHSTNSSVVARPELAVHSCHQRFDAEGRLTDEGTEQLLAELLASLAENIEGRRAASELLSAAGTRH